MTVRIALSLIVLSAAASAAKNTPCAWDSDVEATVVEYWHVDTPPKKGDLRCNGGDCSLSGWLLDSRTNKTGNKPAILFLHGSVGTNPTDPTVNNNYVCTLANYFIPRGYVIYMPYMRGYGDDSPFGSGPIFATDPHQRPGFVNTGESYYTWSQAKAGDGGHDSTWWTLYYMAHMEMVDIQSSIDYLLGLYASSGDLLVNSKKLAIAGHSFGGARAVLTTSAHLTPLPRAVLDLSGAAMSWDTPDGGDWGIWMEAAAADREMPLYLHMNTLENPDHLLSAVRQTFDAASRKKNEETVGEAVEMIYSRFEIPQWFRTECANIPIPGYWCAHSWFISSTEQSERWLPHVDDFLSRQGM